ncbi:hypothetical protein RFI_26991 [Reticulomyxa filosa]|uniref:ABC-2 type transporter domain-containing protein n=1 Tax=Reticulomyxa filosa TaxID=46433 RepID=X6M944_RETFI|nr:hypothetical protein RFI_26991 [Reticulomyxa filosa]|eukprot:ETO10384.1 hypothetical protein RFI_26991 [Reticulomyxa filosa]
MSDIIDEKKEKGNQEIDRQESEVHLSRMFSQPNREVKKESEVIVWFRHCWAVMYKRFWWTLRDGRAMFFTIVLPCLLAILTFTIQALTVSVHNPKLVLDVNQWYLFIHSFVFVIVQTDRFCCCCCLC